MEGHETKSTIKEKNKKTTFWKYIVPSTILVGGIAVKVYMIYKGKRHSKNLLSKPDLTTVKPVKAFANISESILSKIAKEDISRGVKVNVESESLMTFFYKSAAGKQNQRAQFIYDSKTDRLRYLGDSRANVPKFFYEKLRGLIDMSKWL